MSFVCGFDGWLVVGLIGELCVCLFDRWFARLVGCVFGCLICFVCRLVGWVCACLVG